MNSGVGFGHEAPHHGASNEWWTPPGVFDALRLTFDLDPASPGLGLDFVPAKKAWTAADDGLAQPWDGLVWLNPPYGPDTKRWLERLDAHGEGVALVFSRTDVAWFQRFAVGRVVCFIAGRLRFYAGSRHPTAIGRFNPGTGSCLVAYGEEAEWAVGTCGLGLVARLSEPLPRAEWQEDGDGIARRDPGRARA
jgi:hypothetical protein